MGRAASWMVSVGPLFEGELCLGFKSGVQPFLPEPLRAPQRKHSLRGKMMWVDLGEEMEHVSPSWALPETSKGPWEGG